ncbi:MAG: methionyl-tRNA formyltransferase [Candidatus Roizmanbacteria bacterium]
MLHIAYFGSPQFSAELLQMLAQSPKCNVTYQIDLVVCPEDKPSGRGLALKKSPVKMIAEHEHIPVFDMSARKNIQKLKELFLTKKINVAIVFAYGEIISPELLETLKGRFINVHPSLLPKYRGPSPTTMPILLEEKETGVSLIQMDAQMDTGDIIFQKNFAIEINSSAQSILTQALPIVFGGIIDLIDSNLHIVPKPQDSARATYTQRYSREDGYLSPECLRNAIHNGYIDTQNMSVYARYLVRNPSEINFIPAHVSLYTLWKALHPWPGIWTHITENGMNKRLKIIEIDAQQPMKIVTVQIEGKEPMSWDRFTQDHSV